MRRLFQLQLGEALLFILFFTLPSILAAAIPEVLPYLPFNLATFIWSSLVVLLVAVIVALSRR